VPVLPSLAPVDRQLTRLSAHHDSQRGPMMTLMGTAGYPHCFMALDPATGLAVDTWNGADSPLQSLTASWALLQGDGLLAMLSQDGTNLIGLRKDMESH
jgi:hypothetical protein